jgi:hypothetical protein
VTTYLLGAVVRLWQRLFKDGTDERAVHLEADRRDRDAYEAEIAKAERDHLSARDEAEVAAAETYLEKIRTGELALVPGGVWAFEADPLAAPIPEGHAIAEAELFAGVTANWLSAFTWEASPETKIPLASVQVSEPDPLELDSPTGFFPKGWLDGVLADYKAGARS